MLKAVPGLVNYILTGSHNTSWWSRGRGLVGLPFLFVGEYKVFITNATAYLSYALLPAVFEIKHSSLVLVLYYFPVLNKKELSG